MWYIRETTTELRTHFQSIILSSFPYSETTAYQNHFSELNYNHDRLNEHKMKPFKHTLQNHEFAQSEHRPFGHNGQAEVTYSLRSRIIYKRRQNNFDPIAEKSYKNRRFGSMDISKRQQEQQ